MSSRAAPSETPPDRLDILDALPIAAIQYDLAAVHALFDTLRARGVRDLRAHCAAHPDCVIELRRQLVMVGSNDAAQQLFGVATHDAIVSALNPVVVPPDRQALLHFFDMLWSGANRVEGEASVRIAGGGRRDLYYCGAIPANPGAPCLITFVDISARKHTERALQHQLRRLMALDRISSALSTDLDLHSVVQAVTDAATEHSGAQLGGFFYNAVSEGETRYTLFALSGAQHAQFAHLHISGESPVLGPTLEQGKIVRAADIRTDPRFTVHPDDSLPEPPFPIASYLAVPVLGRSGTVHGALLLGHRDPDVFDAASEDIVASLAARAAIAIESAQLFNAAQHGKAIIDSSQDAILAKDLQGRIISWNDSATRLFGYTAAEMIGQPVLRLIPDDRHDEESDILARIRRGEFIRHFETLRRRKDGSLVEISLSVSPVRDSEGMVIGASKIARDITVERRAAEQQRLLLQEMNHRVKNLFALASGVVSLSARGADSAQDLARSVQSRLGALARAHALTLPSGTADTQAQSTSLHTLIDVILSPYSGADDSTAPRFAVTGDDIALGGSAVTSFALLLHEFATNAAKYGALSLPEGRIAVHCTVGPEHTLLIWDEKGAPASAPPDGEGFGTLLGRATVEGQLAGSIARIWGPDGLSIRLTVSNERLHG
ncbi:PAS domain S-box protein [Sphingomonas sp. C3-2]|uniref:PAS domain S-box protein n=1 Tax=Sphingomonas sp. C3-2 TaxID=3062169 RepID=UPI00294B52B1|nr:PAS domain S-box protein [Sphingomonas sp. C3-2]WOK38328.1 PAS domain S-box protein [Sphingomonas sp. C3-2]